MDPDEVEVYKNAKRERGQYLAILTELAWSIKDLLYGIKSTEKMIFARKGNELDAKVMARAALLIKQMCIL